MSAASEGANLPFDPQRPPWGGPEGGTRPEYRARLAELDAELVTAARQVVAMLEPVADISRPLGSSAVQRGAARLDEVRAAFVQIEDAAFTLTALESPVGRDLREVVAVIRAVYDVARSARLALHVLEHLRTLGGCPEVPADDDLLRMRVLAVELFGAAVEAWAQRDALAHNDLDARDGELDRLRTELQGRPPDCGHAECVVAHVLAVRFLERIGDHAVDTCGHLSWAVTGDRVLAEYGAGRVDT